MRNSLQSGQFYGEVSQRSALPGLVLTETLYSPHLHIPPHSHENAYFCFILGGAYTEVYGNKTRRCVPFTLAFHPPAELHSENFEDTEVRSFNVEVGPSAISRVREYSPILDRSVHLQGGMPSMLALRLYKEFLALDALSPLAIEGLILELIVAASRRRSGNIRRRSDSWLKRAKDLIHARFTESLTLDEVAEVAGVHPVHLAREFTRAFGCTIGNYIRQLRTEHACRALIETDKPLREIALDAGFFDQSHFCRVFLKFTGTTPREYRRQLRPSKSAVLFDLAVERRLS